MRFRPAITITRMTALLLLLIGIGSKTRAEDGAGGIVSYGNYTINAIRDLPYNDGPEADSKKQKLDLYLPKDLKGFPVVMFIHGGAWSSGDRGMYGNLGRIFARNGIGAAIISYRLSPAVQHPSHIEDVARAFGWLKKNIAKYGGRTDQIFVTGQSAGGHLAALLATNETYLKPYKLSPRDIKGVMPISGVYVFRAGRMERILGKGEAAAESASPLKHVTGKEPPFLILYADRDFPGCALMSSAFSNALQEHKIDSRLVEVKDRNHISIIVRLMLNPADPATQELLKFVAKHSGLVAKK